MTERKNPMTGKTKMQRAVYITAMATANFAYRTKHIKKQQSNSCESLSILLIPLGFANARIKELLAL